MIISLHGVALRPFSILSCSLLKIPLEKTWFSWGVFKMRWQIWILCGIYIVVIPIIKIIYQLKWCRRGKKTDGDSMKGPKIYNERWRKEIGKRHTCTCANSVVLEVRFNAIIRSWISSDRDGEWVLPKLEITYPSQITTSHDASYFISKPRCRMEKEKRPDNSYQRENGRCCLMKWSNIMDYTMKWGIL